MKFIFSLSTIAIAVVLLLITGIGATVFITPAYAQGPGVITTSPGMTGVWLGDDGGTYYLRQIGDVVWWVGLSGGNDGSTYSNTFRGTMSTQSINNERINVISGEFVDVPRGAIMNSGKLLLHVSSPNTILKISGGFGTEKWSKLIPPSLWHTNRWQGQFPELTGVSEFTLSGYWQASDGGIYYLKHVWPTKVWWSGMSGGNDGRSFNNIFHGEIKWSPTGPPRIIGEWVDLPRGKSMGSGTLDLRITSPTTFQKVSQTGSGFEATTWKKVHMNAPWGFVPK
jgi:hypothetical protein